MSMLDGFVTFDFSEGVPYASVTKNGVTFNKSVIKKLGCPAYVQLLINPATKQFAIVPCDEGAPRAQAFYNPEKKSNVLLVRWNSRDLLNTICEITGWNHKKESYRIAGSLIPEENLMLFNFNDAEPLT